MNYDKHKVSIVIPTKNEGYGIENVIRSVKKYCGDVIVIDGHSTDNTKDVVLRQGARFILDNKKGKGEALRLGLEKATGEIIIIFDGDGSPDERDIPELILPILQNKADLVITSRRKGGSFDVMISIPGILRTMGSDFIGLLVNKRYGTNFTDVLYCFRAIRKTIIKDLQITANGFDFEQEVLVRCIKKGYRIMDIPSRERKRAWGKSKLNTFAGIKLLYLLCKEIYF